MEPSAARSDLDHSFTCTEPVCPDQGTLGGGCGWVVRGWRQRRRGRVGSTAEQLAEHVGTRERRVTSLWALGAPHTAAH